MTDAPTPVVLDKDQGSLRASPFVPTEGVTASGDLTPPPASLSKAARAGWDAFFAANGRDECPFPLARHDLRRDFEHGWDRAFASACEVENSPSPALGGTEAEGRSEPKDHSTPVGGLEPREWTPNCTLLLRTIAADANIADWARNPTMPDFLRMAADQLDTLQAEIERLREALASATSDQAVHYLKTVHRHMQTVAEALPDDMGLSLGNVAFADTRDWLDCHIDWLERTARQALGGSHD